jgi:hypothetical protein
MSPKRVCRPVFVVRLRALPGIDPIRALRFALKFLKRKFGLVALDVRPGSCRPSGPPCPKDKEARS